MNKSESKYYNTALLMNKALAKLLNEKDFEYITVKEICDEAGVNRSTFYFHYESIYDLLEECVENANKTFLTYFNNGTEKFIEKLKNCPEEDLILITPEYLTPYLKFIKENKIFHQAAIKHAHIMNSYKKFDFLNKNIFKPIFDRFGIDANTENYMILYYLNGITAIINEWIKNGCKEEIEYIEKIIIKCVRPNL